MATNRFFQSGNSGYQSQYVPLKMPFQLMQQNLARTDAKVDNAKQEALGLTETSALGLKDLGITPSERDYYGGTEAAITQKFGPLAVEDYNRSQNKKNEVDSYVSSLLDDDFIMKAAIGDISTGILEARKKYNELKSINVTNQSRIDWREKADKELAKHSGDIISSPWLASGYKAELKKMEANPNYTPSALPLIGKSMDRVGDLLTIMKKKSDSGYDKHDLQVGEMYSRIYGGSGVSGREYEAFATSVLDDNSPIYRNIVSQVDAQIQSGDLDPSFKQTAIDSEIKSLIDSAKQLKHRKSSERFQAKSEGELENENASNVKALIDADAQEFGADQIGMQELGSKVKKLKSDKTEIETFLDKYLTPKGISVEEFKNASREQLTDWGITQMGGFNALQLQAKYNNTVNDLSTWNTQLENNDAAIRNDGLVKFSKDTENELDILNFIRTNPTQGLEILKQLDSFDIEGLKKQATSNPQLAKILQLKESNPELLDQIAIEASEGNLDGLVLSTTNSDHFVTRFGSFDEPKALRFLEDHGVDMSEFVRMKTGSQQLTAAKFDKLIRENSNSEIRNTFNKDISSQKTYNNAIKNSSINTYQRGIITTPGYVIGVTDQEISQMEQISDPNSSEIIKSDGTTMFNPAVAKLLHGIIFKDLLDKKGGGNIKYIGEGQYSIAGSTNAAVMAGYDMSILADEYRKANDGAELKEQDKEALKQYLDSPEAFTLKFNTDRSPSFNADMQKKITSSNSVKAQKGELTVLDVQSESTIKNRVPIMRLENELGDVGVLRDNETFVLSKVTLTIPSYNSTGFSGDVDVPITKIEAADPSDDGKLQYKFTIRLNGADQSYIASNAMGLVTALSRPNL